jgi:hypothetical protein
MEGPIFLLHSPAPPLTVDGGGGDPLGRARHCEPAVSGKCRLTRTPLLIGYFVPVPTRVPTA